MTEIKYINRETGAMEVENVPGGSSMRFIYGNPIGKLSLWLLIKRKFFSAWFGKYMSSGASKKKIEGFVAQHKIDLDKYIVPEGGYATFNDFFYREVKPEYRPIGEGIVSPADGRVLVFPEINDALKFFVKGHDFNLTQFLGDADLAKQFDGGAMCIVRLAPVDYHRYHFPLSGVASKSVLINGSYYSVSPIALQKNMRIFLENKREYTVLETNTHGNVVICDVGATLTGGIRQMYTAGATVEKGDEKGYFYFGGSTLILLFEKGKMTFSTDLVKNSNEGYETLLKMGETIGQ
jgi:phosphatidylserine decarboxylase